MINSQMLDYNYTKSQCNQFIITITLKVITITFVLKHPQKKNNPFAWFHERIISDNKRYE